MYEEVVAINLSDFCSSFFSSPEINSGSGSIQKTFPVFRTFPGFCGFTKFFQILVLSTILTSVLQMSNYFLYPGSHLLSRAVSSQVSSAVCVLTVVFGMGTGVSHRRIATGISLGTFQRLQNQTRSLTQIKLFSLLTFSFGQALDLLVSVSSIHYCTYTSDLSTL